MGGERHFDRAAPKPASAVDDPVLELEAVTEEAPSPVDFDALHAALGDPLVIDELPPAAVAAEDLLEDDPVPTPVPRKAIVSGDSSGLSSAKYASARPHAIPATRAPQEDLNAPAVIVATDDTLPTAPPQMTVPFGPPPHNHPSSGPQPAAYPVTPHPFPAHGPMRAQQPTMPIPEGPIHPRHPRTQTIVVRPRTGPTAKQKLVAFSAMLVLFTSAGMAVIILQRPAWLGIDGPAAVAPPSAASPIPMAPIAPTALGPGTPTTPVTALSAAPNAGPIAPAASSSGAPAPAEPALVAPSSAPAPSTSVVPKPRAKPQPRPVVTASPPSRPVE